MPRRRAQARTPNPAPGCRPPWRQPCQRSIRQSVVVGVRRSARQCRARDGSCLVWSIAAVPTGDVLSVELVTETLDHLHVHAGPRNPCLVLRIKQPFMHVTVGETIPDAILPGCFSPLRGPLFPLPQEVV
jgi:hypothetical protein